MAGRMLGVALGEYFVGRCKGGQPFMGRKFIAAGIDASPTTDFNPFNAAQASLAAPSPFYSETTGGTVVQSPLMKYVWGAARAEWKDRFP
jgi:hypothetical protein